MNESKESGKKNDESAPGNSTFFNEVVYISFGVAFVLLLLLFIAIGFWCYRRKNRKKIERFVRFVIVTFIVMEELKSPRISEKIGMHVLSDNTLKLNIGKYCMSLAAEAFLNE